MKLVRWRQPRSRSLTRIASLASAGALTLGALAVAGAAPASAAVSRGGIVSAAVGQLGDSCKQEYDGIDCSLDWCAAFATWAWQQGGVDVSSLGWTVTTFVNYGDRNGTWHDPGYTPSPGDAMIFGGKGYPTKASGGAHVGIVESVNANGTMTEIGGNQGNRVAENTGTPAQIEAQIEGDGRQNPVPQHPLHPLRYVAGLPPAGRSGRRGHLPVEVGGDRRTAGRIGPVDRGG